MRSIEGIPVDRARTRVTLTYAVRSDLQLGLEYNAQGIEGERLGPLANWRAIDETDRRPALILGTSSDRIGTPKGQAYFATLSKDLSGLTGLPIAPYVGIAWGAFEREWREVAGLRIGWAAELASTHLWDGENLHHVLEWQRWSGRTFGLVVVEQDGDYYLGLNAVLRLPLELGSPAAAADPLIP